MEDSLERKFILALRTMYNGESYEDYLANKKYKCYVVLKEFPEDLLVAELNFFEEKKWTFGRLSSKKYTFLREDATLNNIVTMLPKENIVKVSSRKLDEQDFWNIIIRLKCQNSAIVEKGYNDCFYDFCKEYFKNRIITGSVLNIVVNGNLELYYVKEKYEDRFLGVKLHYDYKTGISITNEEKILDYDFKFSSIDYEKDYHNRILSMINGH